MTDDGGAARGLGLLAPIVAAERAAGREVRLTVDARELRGDPARWRPPGTSARCSLGTPNPAATGETLANPQYGAGGTQQRFLDIKEGLSSGNLAVIDSQDEVRHNPDRFRAPDLGQIDIDVQLQQGLGAIGRSLQGTGYYGGGR